MKHKLLFTFALLGSFAFAQTTFLPKVTINGSTGDAPYAIDSGLIDGDAFIDIVIGTNLGNTIEWYKNNGDNTFTLQTLVSNVLDGIVEVKLVDLNNDGFLDILASAYNNDRVVWFTNDGAGNFLTQNVISNSVLGASGMAVGDINNDTFPDVAVSSYDSDEVIWFSNDGTGSFTLETNKIDNTLNAPGAVKLIDIDSDGDLDAVVGTAAYSGDVIEIFRNDLIPGGTVSFIKDATSVATGKVGIFNLEFEDLDGDSNLDILVSEVSYGGGPNGNLYWYEDNGSGFTETVFTTSVSNPALARFKDLDNDGLNDIVLGNGKSNAGNDLVWFKNNGAGVFAAEEVIDATQSQAFVHAIEDFDADGDLDIATCAYNNDALNYFENQKVVLSIPVSELEKVSIFPNPTTDFLNFEGFDTSMNVTVFDALGKQVLIKTISNSEKLDVSQLAAGIYTIKLNDKFSTKFIKE
ncbi:FG-GAP-like repeat-containing protein [Winogradskyella sp. 4-2091]|uniref:T9SS type A sorting domain-containing protein n=1 Tax=Winogradskyella sp. 4-2091 TaxID=3381659 RepID=UPI0038921965